MDKILTSGTSFVDEYGRERIFNGVNLCDKGWPGDDGKLILKHTQPPMKF